MMGPEIDVAALSQLSSENLRILLRKIPGSKDMIIEPTLMKPLDKFAAMSLIKSCGVDRVFRLEKTPPDTLSSTRVYFMHPDISSTRYVVDHINSRKSTPGLSFHLIFVPRCLHQIEAFLEEEGLHGRVTVHSFSWEIIPLDYDLLSLEFPDHFRQIFGQADTSLLSCVSKSITGIQALFGSIPNRYAIGKNSLTVLTQLDLLESESGVSKAGKEDIGHLFIVDRSLDYATCLLSPVTYESLLDEVFSIVCGTIELDGSKIDADIKDKVIVKLQLSSKDKMFEKIRNKHFSSIFSSLSTYAKQLKHHQNRAATLSIVEMKEFVQKNLKDLQTQSKAISMHIGAAEIIQKEKGPMYELLLPAEREVVTGVGYKEPLSLLEDLMSQLYPIEVALRLLCLICLTNQGILQNDFDRVKSQFLQAYGFEQLICWERLRQMGLISVKESVLPLQRAASTPQAPIPSFQQVSKKFGLVSKVPPQGASSTDGVSSGPSYVFNGVYHPLACKLVLETLKPSNPKVSINDSLKELQIPHKFITGRPSTSKVVLIYFVGGYTLAEVAAFRLLQASTGYQFILAGNSNISGKSIMKCLTS